MFKKYFLLALVAGGLAACAGGDDTGKEADGEDGATGDSCWIGDDICVDYDGDTQAWCDGLPYDNTEYSASPCPGEEVGSCVLEAGNGDYVDNGGTAYYYNLDASAAESACTSAGGTYQ